MYYLLKIDNDGDIKIQKNFIDGKLIKAVINNYLIENNITEYKNDENFDKVGMYCIKIDPNNYKLFNNIQDDDGYILYGQKYQEDKGFLKIVYYSNTFEGKDLMHDEIRKLKKQKERNEMINKKPKTIS